jgi:hypothetical protein
LGLKGKLGKLEQRASQHYDVLRLPDGSEVRFTGEDALEALCAAIEGREHWLLPIFRQIETTMGLPGLIRALEASRELHERGGAR